MTKWILAPAALAILSFSACAGRDGGVPINANDLETQMRAFHGPQNLEQEVVAGGSEVPANLQPRLNLPLYGSLVESTLETYGNVVWLDEAGDPMGDQGIGGAVVSSNGGASSKALQGQPSFERAAELQGQGQLRQARLMYTTLLRDSETPDQIAQCKTALDSINRDLFLSTKEEGDMAKYTIGAGDTLAKIAREHNTTWQFLRRINQLTKSTIFVGDELIVPKGVFSLEVNTLTHEADLFYDGGFIKRYTLTGNADAPAGTYSVAGRLEKNEGGQVRCFVNIDGPAKISIQSAEGETSSTIPVIANDATEIFDLLPVGVSVTIIG